MNLLKRRTDGDVALATAPEVGLAAFRREMDRALERAFGYFDDFPFAPLTDVAIWPAVDVTEDEKAITLRVDLPGMEAKDVQVEIDGDQLNIRGSRAEEVKDEKKGFRRHERCSGTFSRSITVPTYVDTEKMEAKYEKGVLTVTAPKIPGKGPKRLAVKTA